MSTNAVYKSSVKSNAFSCLSNKKSKQHSGSFISGLQTKFRNDSNESRNRQVNLQTTKSFCEDIRKKSSNISFNPSKYNIADHHKITNISNQCTSVCCGTEKDQNVCVQNVNTRNYIKIRSSNCALNRTRNEAGFSTLSTTCHHTVNKHNDLRSISASNSTVKSTANNIRPEIGSSKRKEHNPEKRDSENSVIFESTITMDIDDLQSEAHIQLPLKSKPIECLMSFKLNPYQSNAKLKSDKNIKESKIHHFDSQKLKLKDIQNEAPQSEISEYVYTFEAENCTPLHIHNEDAFQSKDEAKNQLITEAVFRNLRHQNLAGESSQKSASNCIDLKTKECLTSSKDVIESRDLNLSIVECSEQSSLNLLNLSEVIIESKWTKFKHQSPNKLVLDKNFLKEMKKAKSDQKKLHNDDLNEILKDVLRSNIHDTCELRNKVRILENQLSKAKVAIQNLQKSYDGDAFPRPTSSNFDRESRKASLQSKICRSGSKCDNDHLQYNCQFKVQNPENPYSSAVKLSKGNSYPSREAKSNDRLSDSQFRNELNKLKSEYEEDLEFQRNELEAMYLVKFEEASRSQNNCAILHEGKSLQIDSELKGRDLRHSKIEGMMLSPNNKTIMDSLKSLNEIITSSKTENRKDELLVITLEENKVLKAENQELKLELHKHNCH